MTDRVPCVRTMLSEVSIWCYFCLDTGPLFLQGPAISINNFNKQFVEQRFFSHHCHLILNLSKFNSFFILVAISLILELLSYMGFNPVCCLISSIKLITVCCFMYKLASVFCQKHRAPQKTDHLYNPTGMLTPLSLDR